MKIGVFDRQPFCRGNGVESIVGANKGEVIDDHYRRSSIMVCDSGEPLTSTGV